MEILKDCPYPIKYFLEKVGDILIIKLDLELNIIEANDFFTSLFPQKSSELITDYMTIKSSAEFDLTKVDDYYEQVINFSSSVNINYTALCHIYRLNDGYLIFAKEVSVNENNIFNRIALLNNELANTNRELAKKNHKLKQAKQELRDYYQELEMQNLELKGLYEDLEAQFEKGHRLHSQFLPSSLPQIENISCQAYFQPSYKLGGDFYDMIEIGNQLFFYLSDISGHGLDGSILNIFVRESINNYLLYKHNNQEQLSLKELINHIKNKYHNEDFPGDYFICLLMGVLDLETYELVFANAGFQIAPIIVNGRGKLEYIDCAGMPISSAIKQNNVIEAHSSFKKGDIIFLTTDGLIEEASGDQMYGKERLEATLRKNYYLPLNVLEKKINQDFKAFSGRENAKDDITFISLKRE